MAYEIIGGGSAQKALTVDQFFDYLEQMEDPGDMRDLYAKVAWHYRCIQLRANAVAAVPFDIYAQDADPETAKPVEIDDDLKLENVLWEIEAWLSLRGEAYVLKQRNRLNRAQNTVKALQVLNAYTMRPVVDEDRPERGIIAFEQTVNGKAKRYAIEEIVYFRRWSPRADIGPGIAPSQPGATPGQLVDALNKWAAAFFENGAVPLTLLTTETPVPEVERDRIQTFWEKVTKGAKKAFSTMVLRKGMDVKVIGQPVDELAMPELSEEERYQIAAAYGVPLSMLGAKDVNRATAEIDELKFWNENMVPEWRHKIKPTLDEQLFNPMDLQIIPDYKSVEALQAQEIQKGENAAFLINGVMLPAYEANVVSVDETRAVIDEVLSWVAMPRLDKSFTPEDRAMPTTQPGGNGEGPGANAGANTAENVEANTRPKALAPEWGHLRISLPSLVDGVAKQKSEVSR